MFRDGTPSGGRPKGALNLTTRSIQTFCRGVAEDPQYQETVLRRARDGTLGAMEPVILAYAYGKPKESIDVRVAPIEDEFSGLSIEELARRAADITAQLDEANALAAALPAEYREQAKSPAVLSVDTNVDVEKSAESEHGLMTTGSE